MGWVVKATPRLLYPRERDPILVTQKDGWAQDWSGWVRTISPSHRDSIPVSSSPQRVTIPTALSRPTWTLIGRSVEESGGGLISDIVQKRYWKDSGKEIPRENWSEGRIVNWGLQAALRHAALQQMGPSLPRHLSCTVIHATCILRKEKVI
jgi:hypothetical protein